MRRQRLWKHVAVRTQRRRSLSRSFNPSSFSTQRVFRSRGEDAISASGARFCSCSLKLLYHGAHTRQCRANLDTIE